MKNPNATSIKENAENNTLVDMTFFKDGESPIIISISKPQLQTLIQLAQKEVLKGQSAILPINKGALQEDETYLLESFSVAKGTGLLKGHRQLLLRLRLPEQNNRGVSLPIKFNPEDIKYIIEEFTEE